MPYPASETSAHDGSPVEGYKFIGTNQTFRYTTAELPVSISGEVYTPAEIERNAIRSGTHDDDSLDLELTVPVDLDIIQQYAFDNSPPDLRLQVFRYHDQDNPASEFIIAWDGQVTAFTVSGEEARIRVPSIFELAMRGMVPSAYYHSPCNNVLYDDLCKANRPTKTKNTTIGVGGVTGAAITVVDDGFADNALKAGIITLSSKGEKRLIVDNVANLITINFPFNDAQDGDLIELVHGCNHAFAGDCLLVHNNQVNYTGQPFIPTDNPHEGEL